MISSFGIHNTSKDWEGPIIREFKIHSDHNHVVRYDCPLETSVFELYVPKFLLADIIIENKIPDTLTAEIGKSDNTRKTVGFKSKPIPLRVDKGICEYEFAEEKVNSYRYDVVYKAYPRKYGIQRYALYIPKEEFGTEVRPQVVYVKLVQASYLQ